ncbi:TetR/AcrR family transcriptional regulator [Streptomyces sp. NPDC048278]|uniref:TetR/AcrR family transcriptional regulator n=1 Tax=Streptomyces sp. NPDC048278 TaxID=3155809 RepID=UPI0034279A66
MAPRQQRGAATAEALLDAVLRVHAAEGERGLTVHAVTEACGVSAGSLYHHFGSIEGLTAAVTLRWLERLLAEMTAELAGARTAREGIGAAVGAYLAFVRDHRDAALLIHSPSADLGPFVRWAEAQIRCGELAPLPAPLIDALVLGPMIGVARRWLSGIDDVDLEEAARVLPDRIWRAVGSTG